MSSVFKNGKAVALLSERRRAATVVADNARLVATAAQAMAQRFKSGGKLMVFADNRAAAAAQHVAVEFVHPVIVGKRAIPAISLLDHLGPLAASHADRANIFAATLRKLASPNDVAFAVSSGGESDSVIGGLEAAAQIGMLTIALAGANHDLTGHPAVRFGFCVPSADPLVVTEVQVTLYHVLWELTHLFLEQSASRREEVFVGEADTGVR